MTDYSYQLYSSRNFPPLSRSFAMLAAAGYRKVEGYGGLFSGLTALAEVRAALDTSGLRMASGHFDLDMIRD
ncbi:MAG: sugar phosphate isomerase/epimerase, partial [Paracoccaceae bacterium]